MEAVGGEEVKLLLFQIFLLGVGSSVFDYFCLLGYSSAPLTVLSGLVLESDVSDSHHWLVSLEISHLNTNAIWNLHLMGF